MTAVAVVAVAAVTLWATSGGTANPGPAARPAATRAPRVQGGLNSVWSQSVPSVEAAIGDPETWLVGDQQIVAAENSAAIGYSYRSGQQQWMWRAPATTDICGAGSGTVDGLGVLVYGGANGNDSECDNIVAVNTSTGKSAWGPVSASFYGVSGNSAVIMDSSSNIDGLSMSSGQTAWSSANDQTLTNQNCAGYDAATSDTVIYGVFTCGDSASPYGLLASLNPQTGALLSAVRITGGCVAGTPAYSGNGLYQTPPLYALDGYAVIDCAAQNAQGETPGQSFAVSAVSGVAKPLDITASGFDPLNQVSDNAPHPQNLAAYGSTLYVETPQAVDAFDMATGSELWSDPLGSEFTLIQATPAGLEGLNRGLIGAKACNLALFEAATGKLLLGSAITGNVSDLLGTADVLIANGSTIIAVADGVNATGLPNGTQHVSEFQVGPGGLPQ